MSTMTQWLRCVGASALQGIGAVEVMPGWTVLAGAKLGRTIFCVVAPEERLVNLGPETLLLILSSAEMRARDWIVGRACTLVERGEDLPAGYSFVRCLRDDSGSLDGLKLKGSPVDAGPLPLGGGDVEVAASAVAL